MEQEESGVDKRKRIYDQIMKDIADAARGDLFSKEDEVEHACKQPVQV